METKPEPPDTHYQRPDWFTRNVMNRFLNLLMRLGISAWGSRVLEHRGRRSGQLHRTPVNLLTLGSNQFLVAARGETEWVRNVRAADGHLVLLLGRKRQLCTAVEIPLAERTPILRAYLERWKFEVGMFFQGVGPDSTDAEFEAIAERHPVFVLR
ncbi:MAG TPA: nitroreductase/quinone reductase family protein [Acidimicrobiales bacterium]|jgi:deazaflavin-dependent oxidoreductase (nitroreductase family)|nr:nitroreductase/quinone reductase family protein [Acidimicrobiales bacterium]